jgi:RNA-binding protein
MMESLTGAQKRQLKSIAQRLEATVRVGKNGLSDGFFKELNDALERSELVKVRFSDFKDEKKELAPQISEKSGSHFITRVGNVAVYFRQQPDPEKRRVNFSS